uniref:Uncharacterized protein n=1 Tax=Arundo donax TaxID=35708 RepID=A0A0A9AUZ6_ARUDO
MGAELFEYEAFISFCLENIKHNTVAHLLSMILTKFWPCSLAESKSSGNQINNLCSEMGPL